MKMHATENRGSALDIYCPIVRTVLLLTLTALALWLWGAVAHGAPRLPSPHTVLRVGPGVPLQQVLADIPTDAGATITVAPGLYLLNRTNLSRSLLRDNVNWHFEAGAVVSNNVPTNATSQAYAIFDDRGLGGVNCTISGEGVFIANMTVGLSNSAMLGGVLVLTNPASNVTLRGRRAEGWASGITATARQGSLLRVQNAGKVYIDLDEVIGPEYTVGSGAVVGMNGLLWVRGDVWMRCRLMKVEGYGIWGETPQSDMLGTTNDFYYEGDLIQTTASQAVFFSMSNYTHRAWVRVGEIKSENALGTINLQDGGRVYITAEKIGSVRGTNGTIVMTRSIAGSPGVQAWITAQKISSDTTWLTADSSFLWARVDDWEDSGAVSPGMTLTSGISKFYAGDFAVKNGNVVLHAGGTNYFNNCRIDSRGTNTIASVTDNYAISMGEGTSNLVLNSCALLSPIATGANGGAYTIADGIGLSHVVVYGTLTCNSNVLNVKAVGGGTLTTNQPAMR
jgi:hypothetical protein